MKNSTTILTCIFGLIVFALIVSPLHAQVTDYDGKTYPTVVIGRQVWMAEDLQVKHYRNGDPIQVIDCPRDLDNQKSPMWNSTQTGALCIEKKPGRDVYIKGGRNSCVLYNWHAVNDSRGLAPEGWHIPSQQEWMQLIEFLGGVNVAGNMMKSLNGWDYKYATNGNNISGFNALPTGERSEVGFYMGFSQYAWYWTSSPDKDYYAHCLQLGWQVQNSSALLFGNHYRQAGLAVRCVKDE